MFLHELSVGLLQCGLRMAKGWGVSRTASLAGPFLIVSGHAADTMLTLARDFAPQIGRH